MKTIESQAIKFGLITTALLVLYFLAMKAFGLVHNVNLRFFNGIIMSVGVYWAISGYKKQNPNKFSYLEGIGLGVITSLVVALLFSAFISLYIFAFPDFLTKIKIYEPQGIYLNQLAIAVILFIEALASGCMISFISMQWLKKERPFGIRKPRKYSLNH
ncbi:MAG: DUF4199 domain-containing protein [Marinoscillum sp.]